MSKTSFSGRKELKRVFSGLLARFWRRRRIVATELLRSKPGRILIVRQHNQMGDMVCATPAFRAVRETFPEAEIGLVCAPINRDVVLHNPHLDKIFLYDKHACTRLGPLWRFLQELRAFRPDLALILNSVSFSVTSAVLALGSGAKLVVGNDSAPFGFDVSRHAYSLELPSYPVMDRHAIDHHLAPLLAVGVRTGNHRTVVVPSAAERRQAAEIAAWSASLGKALWIMHPGAGKVENLWPTARFAAVAAEVIEQGFPLLVLQGPADEKIIAEFRSVMRKLKPGHEQAWRVNPPVTVGVCAALLERADRFLCNDTGLMHVAGAVGVPTVALFGPTNPDLWAPRNEEMTVLRASGGRLAAVTVAEVWHRLHELKGRPGPQGMRTS